MGKSRRPWIEKVSLSACEALADARRGRNSRCVGWVSVASVGLKNGRMSGWECSLLPASGGRSRLDSLFRTGKDGKVKLGGQEALYLVG